MFTLLIPAPKISGISKKKFKIAGWKGKKINLEFYRPKGFEKKVLPLLIYFHGGGFCIGAAPLHKKMMARYAIETPCSVLFVDYHLSLDYPYPAGLEDCYESVVWAKKSAALLSIDETHIAVGGDSSGGALCAAVNLLLRDRGGLRLCAQMLIYPVTDHRMKTHSMRKYTDTPVWNSRQSEKMWEYYLRDCGDSIPLYASPNTAESLVGMPDTYIETAEFDCLHDEGIEFATRLIQEGINVELLNTKGTVHVYDIIASSSITEQSVKKRISFLKRNFL